MLEPSFHSEDLEDICQVTANGHLMTQQRHQVPCDCSYCQHGCLVPIYSVHVAELSLFPTEVKLFPMILRDSNTGPGHALFPFQRVLRNSTFLFELRLLWALLGRPRLSGRKRLFPVISRLQDDTLVLGGHFTVLYKEPWNPRVSSQTPLTEMS